MPTSLFNRSIAFPNTMLWSSMDIESLEIDNGLVKRDMFTLIEIGTEHDGRSHGRSHFLRCSKNSARGVSSNPTAEEIVCQIQKAVQAAKSDRLHQLTAIQETVANKYSSLTSRIVITAIIICNFVVQVLKSESQPDPSSRAAEIYDRIDFTLGIFFLFEFACNLFAHWRTWTGAPFLTDRWNFVEAAIAVLTVVGMVIGHLASVSLLRLLRVLRVPRLFKNLSSLRTVLQAIAASVESVASAFAVLIVVTSIFAVLASQLYRNQNVAYFGNFSASLFTMFQVATGDGWAEYVTRPLFANGAMTQASHRRSTGNGTDVSMDGALSSGLYNPEAPIRRPVAAFFVVYHIIAGVILLNVVVAILLDEFITSVQRENRAKRLHQSEKQLGMRSSEMGILDPLLASLASRGTNEDLDRRVAEIFQAMGDGETEALTADMFTDGLGRLGVMKGLRVTAEDFDALTEGHALCDADGRLRLKGFRRMVAAQLRGYVHRRLTKKVSEEEANDSEDQTLYLALKTLLLRLDRAEPTLTSSTAIGSGGQSPAKDDAEGMYQVMRRLDGTEARLIRLDGKVDRVLRILACLNTTRARDSAQHSSALNESQPSSPNAAAAKEVGRRSRRHGVVTSADISPAASIHTGRIRRSFAGCLQSPNLVEPSPRVLAPLFPPGSQTAPPAATTAGLVSSYPSRRPGRTGSSSAGGIGSNDLILAPWVYAASQKPRRAAPSAATVDAGCSVAGEESAHSASDPAFFQQASLPELVPQAGPYEPASSSLTMPAVCHDCGADDGGSLGDDDWTFQLEVEA